MIHDPAQRDRNGASNGHSPRAPAGGGGDPRPNPETALLDAWEQAQAAATLPARALALLTLADPGAAQDALPVGVANARLLGLRSRLFGPKLTCVIDCPQCGERLEVDFSVGDLLSPAANPPDLTILDGEERVRFRLPTWVDLAAIAGSHGGADRRRLLLERCLVGRDTAQRVALSALEEALVAAMEAADPLAEILIEVGCFRCDKRFETRFDIVEHLFAEVDVRARQLLGEVHVLAAAYGWTEPEVLALSPARRRMYLELVRG
jgi:hypothetical protein